MSEEYGSSPGARRKVSDPLGRLSDISSGSSFGSNPGSPRLLPRRPRAGHNLSSGRRLGSNSSLVEGMHSLDSGVSEWERSASPSRLASDQSLAEKCIGLQIDLHRSKQQIVQMREIYQDKVRISIIFLYN